MAPNQKLHLAKANALVLEGSRQIDRTKSGLSESAAEKLTLANKELLKAGKIKGGKLQKL